MSDKSISKEQNLCFILIGLYPVFKGFVGLVDGELSLCYKSSCLNYIDTKAYFMSNALILGGLFFVFIGYIGIENMKQSSTSSFYALIQFPNMLMSLALIFLLLANI